MDQLKNQSKKQFSPKRRQTLAVMGAGSIGLLAACGATNTDEQNRPPMPPDGARSPMGNRPPPPPDGGFQDNSPLPNNSQGNPQCYAKAQQTEGPYFVDEKLNRSDIRPDPSTGKVSAGVPLELSFVVSNINGAACDALANAMVDIWHCDAQGVYSDVGDAKGQKFLRGFQNTDAQGRVQFTTIYPGWYQGRTTHIHFKIRWTDAQNRSHSFTSQLYFDDALTDVVYQNTAYKQRARDTRNSNDGIFRRGGSELTLKPQKTASGYAAEFRIGLSNG